MDKIILTGSYDNCKIGNTISISGDKGKSVGYTGKTLTTLAPKLSFWKTWHDNIGKISEAKNNKFYIKEFYNQVLKQLDPETVLLELPNKSILLCYENNEIFCHRHLVAFWLELFLGIKTYEVKIDEPKKELIILKRPEYLKNELENIIKEDYHMAGYNSIRAAYLFHQASELEKIYDEQANEFIKIFGSVPSGEYPGTIMTEAAGLRVEADEVEARYIKQKRKNI